MDRMTLVFLSTGWGTSRGGINPFNFDLCASVAAASNAQVICVVPSASEMERIDAREKGVELIIPPSPDPSGKSVDRLNEPFAKKALKALDSARIKVISWWIGHDIITGFAALACKEITRKGQCAVIQHMNYLAYESLKESNGPAAVAKANEQREVLAKADIVCAVGPKLSRAAQSYLKGSGIPSDRVHVLELIPGVAQIEGVEPPDNFTAIVFGRLDPRAERIKQGRLAVAAFGNAVKKRGVLPLYADFSLTVIGLDRNTHKEQNEELLDLAESYADRLIPVNGLPYTADRNNLFSQLRQHSAALMLSIHEGFGLTGWEAISAEVPLVLSKNSGLYELIDNRLGGSGTGCVKGVDIKGTRGDRLREEDVDSVSDKLLEIMADQTKAKRDARNLKSQLARKFTWPNAARAFGTELGIPIKEEQLAIGLAAGLPDKEICGLVSIDANKKTEEHKRAHNAWVFLAKEVGRLLAVNIDPPIRLIHPGVHAGSFSGLLVDAFSESPGGIGSVTTVFHEEFQTDAAALKYIREGYPSHFEDHNVDTTKQYLQLVGDVVRVGTITRRRIYLVESCDMLLSVAGYFAVGEMIGLAKERNIPILAIGAFGGETGRRINEIIEYNSSLKLSYQFHESLKKLATAPLKKGEIIVLFTSALLEASNYFNSMRCSEDGTV